MTTPPSAPDLVARLEAVAVSHEDGLLRHYPESIKTIREAAAEIERLRAALESIFANTSDGGARLIASEALRGEKK